MARQGKGKAKRTSPFDRYAKVWTGGINLDPPGPRPGPPAGQNPRRLQKKGSK